MKIKNLSEEELIDIVSTVDNEGFWYSITGGGYLIPENLLVDEEDIKKVKEAIKILKEFESLIPIL